MEKLTAAIYQMVQDQHPAKVKSLCSRIKNISIDDSPSLTGFFITESANKALDGVLREWQRVSCSSEELAGLIVGASIGCINERDREKVDLVWAGPDVNQCPVRRSEQVLLDVINSATESLFIVSFVLVNIPSIERALARAIDRGVDVRLLIESEDKENSGDFRKTVVRLAEDIPGISLYVWPREKRDCSDGGFARVHAKCAVADGKTAFLTSANLTSAALDKNIEMGVQIDGGNIPEAIARQFIAMMNVEEIVPFAVDQRGSVPAKKENQKVSLSELKSALEDSSSVLVEFHNEKLNIQETRLLERCMEDQEKPKANSIVVIEHEGQLIIGKYTWSKQQDINDDGDQFYRVAIRGFAKTQSFKMTEEEWSRFRPIAVELKK